MNSTELANIDNIVNDDNALSILVNNYIKGNDGDFVFILPEGTSVDVRNTFDNFINKVNFGFSTVGRATKILPTIVKVTPVVIPEPVIEKVVIPEPVIEPEVILEPEPVVAVDLTKRKK